jgi:hypothetical protein
MYFAGCGLVGALAAVLLGIPGDEVVHEFKNPKKKKKKKKFCYSSGTVNTWA